MDIYAFDSISCELQQMRKMTSSSIEFADLPDEILLIIFKKVDQISLFSSLMGVGQRFDRVLCDSTLMKNFSLVEHYSRDRMCLLNHELITRFCLSILPRIAEKIEWIDVEISAMERVLLSGNYFNLSGIGIYNVNRDDLRCYLSGKIGLHWKFWSKKISLDQNVLTDLFKNQITSLVVQTMFKEGCISKQNFILFVNLIEMFSNLKSLNYDPFNGRLQAISFDGMTRSVRSSALLELRITVCELQDCLHILDGRFSQLRSLDVKVRTSFCRGRSPSEEKILKLKYFSFFSYSPIDSYDSTVLPLLQRMSNLEELYLNFDCFCQQSFIDGNNLKVQILSKLPFLKTFHFNIRSFVCRYDRLNLLSNESIRKTFEQFPGEQVVSCIDYFPEENQGQCHIYSHPYTLTTYERITNHFPGGFFLHVRQISLYDEKPFEHQFFVQIQKSFPLLKDLAVVNRKAQENSRGDSKLIHFPYLTRLWLNQVHDDYVEQFLLETRTALPFNLEILVIYEVIKRVTHEFKRTETRINCGKVKCVYSDCKHQVSKDFRKYFLQTEHM